MRVWGLVVIHAVVWGAAAATVLWGDVSGWVFIAPLIVSLEVGV